MPWPSAKVQFVMGDLLPGDLVDEYRVQLQKFLQDPSDANDRRRHPGHRGQGRDVRLMSQVALTSRGSQDGNSSRALEGERKLTPLRRWVADAPAAYLLLLPVLVLFAFAVVYPVVQTVWLSFWDIKGLGKPKFYGLGNYIALANDATFRQAVVTTLIWTICTTVHLGRGSAGGSRCFAPWRPAQTLIPRVMIFAAFGVSEAVTGYIWLGVFRRDAGGTAQRCSRRDRPRRFRSPVARRRQYGALVPDRRRIPGRRPGCR